MVLKFKGRLLFFFSFFYNALQCAWVLHVSVPVCHSDLVWMHPTPSQPLSASGLVYLSLCSVLCGCQQRWKAAPTDSSHSMFHFPCHRLTNSANAGSAPFGHPWISPCRSDFTPFSSDNPPSAKCVQRLNYIRNSEVHNLSKCSWVLQWWHNCPPGNLALQNSSMHPSLYRGGRGETAAVD